MNILEIIDKKRINQPLTKEEITYFIENYVNGNIKDYQASALLMAICINGMNEEETFNLCDAMLKSGEIVDLSYVNGITVDKHSSGGVSDTTSIALIPILACAGLCSVKMSGAGLGFTGGTTDKLASFQGIDLQISQDKIKEIIGKCGCIIVSQSQNLVPADKKLYALRDTSSTIQSIPLIATSIMSKKIASGNDIIFLDVKTGKGAFMENAQDAKVLAETLIKIGSKYNKKVATLISDMNEPLGNGIGCYLEILDAIDVLNGKPSRLYDLVKFMAVKIMVLSEQYSEESATQKFDEIIESRQGYQRLLSMVELLNGNIESIKTMQSLTPTTTIYAKYNGYVESINAKELGLLVCDMGGGRKELDDKIDHSVGVKILKHIGDKVQKNEPIALIYNTNQKLSENLVCDRLESAITITTKKVEPTLLIKEYKHN
ncbi:MAG: thymidine phosphorylase [Clostridia bacterium]|nr:thymidine phosphorylase [Clostridia bacterium]